MPALHDLKDEDLQGLAPEAVTALAQQMLQRIRQQAHEIQFKDAKIEKIMFQLAQLKAWKFGAKTEAMNAEQRRLFEETVAEDEASLQAQLGQLRGATPSPETTGENNDNKRKPRRRPLPEHLRRVEHHHEPEDTSCPSPECGRPMVRVGEDVSERLDVIPAEFFVHRHIYGKWACRCCQCLVQEPAAPQIIDGGMPAAGLVAHTMVSHFVDHLPYYRLESINARSGVHTPRSTLASWSGRGGAALVPLYDAHKRFVLSAAVLHADETPVAMLDPGAGKTKRAYVWTYARGAFDAVPGVIYDFCAGRGAQYPVAFLGPEDDRRSDPGWLSCAREEEVRRVAARRWQERGRRRGIATHRADLSSGARAGRLDEPGETDQKATGRKAAVGGPAFVVASGERPCTRRQRHSQGSELQPQCLERVDAKPTRWRRER